MQVRMKEYFYTAELKLSSLPTYRTVSIKASANGHTAQYYLYMECTLHIVYPKYNPNVLYFVYSVFVSVDCG